MKLTPSKFIKLLATLTPLFLFSVQTTHAQEQAQKVSNSPNNRPSKQCIEINENKRFYERSLKAYPGLQKKECIKLPHLAKNLKPLSLTANEEYLTAFLTVHDTTKVDSEELHYIDTKEGKVIKRFKLGGVLNRNFKNQSKSFITFDNDSRVAFSIDGSFCVFNLRKSKLIHNDLYKAKLDGCSKINLNGQGVKSIEDLESLTLSKNHNGFRYLWSLNTNKNKKYVYGFKLNKNKLLPSPVYKFKLPDSLSKASKVSFIESNADSYTLAVSTNKEQPTKHLHKVVYRLDDTKNEYKMSSITPLTENLRTVASQSNMTKPSLKNINYYHFVNLERVYKN